MSQYAVRVQGLTKHYGDTAAVEGISFTVPSGMTTGLLGGNGAGKTTTIAMMLGVLLPTSGTIEILGHDVARDRFAVLPRMNFSSPYVDLPHRLTVRENLTVYAHLYGVRNHRPLIDRLAEELDLTALLSRPSGKLSAGQKTRVALAKALLNTPDVLLLDEPTASLDPDTADRMRGYLETYQRRTGAAILLASHNMGEVSRLCSHIIMMRRGQIVAEGSPTTLLERYGREDLEDVFLDIARERGLAAGVDAHDQ